MNLKLNPDALVSKLLVADYAALDFVMPGLPLGLVGSWVGQGGCGKSYLALEAALSIAMGRKFGRDTPKRGKVFYFATEDPLNQLGQRVQNILSRWGVASGSPELAFLDANFHLFPLLGEKTDIMEEDDGPVILDQIEALIAGFGDGGDPLRLLVLDTLRRFHTLDENSNGEMARVLGVMERIAVQFKCSVLFIHHVTKNAAANGQAAAQQAARGASVLVDNIRYQANVVNMSEEESAIWSCDGKAKIKDGRKFFVKFAVPKNNYGSPLDDQWFKRDAKTGVLDPVTLVKVEKK